MVLLDKLPARRKEKPSNKERWSGRAPLCRPDSLNSIAAAVFVRGCSDEPYFQVRGMEYFSPALNGKIQILQGFFFSRAIFLFWEVVKICVFNFKEKQN